VFQVQLERTGGRLVYGWEVACISMYFVVVVPWMIALMKS
jgi:hypothetical protein